MTRSALPSTLDAFLDQRVRCFNEPPDAGWYFDIAQVYSTAPADVEAAFRAKWTAAHVPVASAPAAVEGGAQVRHTETLHPFERVLNALRARGGRVLAKHDARGRESRRATCPAHDDRNPSLVVTSDGPNVLVHCFGGCPTARVVAALGMKMADLFSGPKQAPSTRKRQTVSKEPPRPKPTAEERLARRRELTAARTREWRKKKRLLAESVTLGDAPEHTGDAGDAGDAPNVLLATSQVSIERDSSVHSVEGSHSAEGSTATSDLVLPKKRAPLDDDWRRR